MSEARCKCKEPSEVLRCETCGLAIENQALTNLRPLEEKEVEKIIEDFGMIHRKTNGDMFIRSDIIAKEIVAHFSKPIVYPAKKEIAEEIKEIIISSSSDMHDALELGGEAGKDRYWKVVNLALSQLLALIKEE